MPTVPSGYPDWQRQQSYDGPTLWNEQSALTNAAIISPVFDVSRFAYLGGTFQVTTGQCIVIYTWALDQGFTLSAGQRAFVMDSRVITPMTLQMVNLGPYLRIKVVPLFAGNYQFQALLFANNRTHPFETIPQLPTLVLNVTEALGIGASADIWPLDYWAGPVRIWVFDPVSPWIVELDGFDLTGGRKVIEQWIPAVGRDSHTFITPMGAWVLSIVNATGGANTLVISAVASMTGST